jgi:MerR family transcriptional regulator/heat shock protein HspR
VDERDAVFIISVAARLVDLHPSTLRKYERCGLLEPGRMSGRLRLYSPEDIGRLRQIKQLVEERGVNLAGLKLAFDLTAACEELERLCDEETDDARLREQVRALTRKMLAALGAESARPSLPRTPSRTEPTARAAQVGRPASSPSEDK